MVQIKKTSNNQYRLNMVASNGQVLATSFTWQDPSIALVAAEPYQSSSTASILRDDQATSARTWLR